MLLINQCPKCKGSLRPMDFEDGVECINCGLTRFNSTQPEMIPFRERHLKKEEK